MVSSAIGLTRGTWIDEEPKEIDETGRGRLRLAPVYEEVLVCSMVTVVSACFFA